MREVPELTFRGALSVLGHYGLPVLERLSKVLGGAITVGGVVGLAGPAVAPVAKPARARSTRMKRPEDCPLPRVDGGRFGCSRVRSFR